MPEAENRASGTTAMIPAKTYVVTDERGALRVAGTRVSIDSVVYAYLQGHSPETIIEQYPALSLEQVHGAIAFYLANKAEVDQYLDKQEQLWEKLRQEQERNPSPVVRRLRALRESSARKEP
jgi:uncharacterized protein (DUF433 family)